MNGNSRDALTKLRHPHAYSNSKLKLSNFSVRQFSMIVRTTVVRSAFVHREGG